MRNAQALDDASSAAISALLGSAKYELIPLKNVMEAAAHLPADAVVSVTASPAKGMDATMELSEALAARGFRVIPHLSARLTQGRDQVAQMVERMERAGITRAFVVGGDVDEPGPFVDGLALLQALEEEGHGLDEIGIPCYPEGHPRIPDEALFTALRDKSRYASYMTTQMCFDPEAIRSWIKSVRAQGIDLPVHIGLPGVAPLHKLLTISARIGIGDSVRFLAKNTSLVGKLVRPGGYAPDELIAQMASTFVDPGADIQGFHVYTFNQVESTERWRLDFAAQLNGAG